MPKKTRQNLVAVHGASGRMGQEILRLAGNEGWKNTLAVGEEGWKGVTAQKVDIVIDFSSPEGFRTTLDWCVKNKKPLVSGTTGLSAKDKKDMTKAAKKIPILWAANMSLGVHVFANALKSLAAVKDWSFQIEETHHVMKKDKPSGTALFLQNRLQKVTRQKSLPNPISHRVGNVIGDHRVSARSAEEEIVFEHKAISRSVFARGALIAASWLLKRKAKAKLYEMSEVLFG
jgi:4-hydroxy-tetrahydrodipicolinate reductase